MTEGIIAVLGIAVLLYVLLGGADFGAGMVEGRQDYKVVFTGLVMMGLLYFGGKDHVFMS